MDDETLDEVVAAAPKVGKKKGGKKKAAKKSSEAAEIKPLKIGSEAIAMIDGLRETFGADSEFQLLGSDYFRYKIRGVISTQCATIDHATGRGGVPLGRITVVHGTQSAGKTTLSLHLAAEVQRMGGLAIYIDKEHKLDPEYAQAIGVDTDRLIISQPSFLEQVVDRIIAIIDRAAVIRAQLGRRVPVAIFVDSINACLSQARYEGDPADKHYGPEAAIWSQTLPKIVEKLQKEDVALVMVSQVRKKFGVMYGDDENMAGGMAVPHHASLILHVKYIGSEKNDDKERVANRVRVECKKNQIAPPFKKAEAWIRFGLGYDKATAILELATKLGVVELNGNTYSFDGKKIAVSEKKAAKELENEELRDRVMAAIIEKRGW